MGIKTININNPLLIDSKYINKSLLFESVCKQIKNFISSLKEECSNYQENYLSNNGAEIINNMENYLLEISFKYKDLQVFIEYHFCDNKEISKMINNINIIIHYKFDDIIDYSFLIDKLNILKVSLTENSTKINNKNRINYNYVLK